MSFYNRSALKRIRNNAKRTWSYCAESIIASSGPEALSRPRVLEVAPQIHGGLQTIPAIHELKRQNQIGLSTLDIDPQNNPTIVGDLCNLSGVVSDASFEFVVVAEVLEHVSDPFSPCKEIFRVRAPGGEAFITTPFDFRIHGPLPDNWIFTEHGLRFMLGQFEAVEITPQLFLRGSLMPVSYSVRAIKSRFQ